MREGVVGQEQVDLAVVDEVGAAVARRPAADVPPTSAAIVAWTVCIVGVKVQVEVGGSRALVEGPAILVGGKTEVGGQ